MIRHTVDKLATEAYILLSMVTLKKKRFENNVNVVDKSLIKIDVV